MSNKVTETKAQVVTKTILGFCVFLVLVYVFLELADTFKNVADLLKNLKGTKLCI